MKWMKMFQIRSSGVDIQDVMTKLKYLSLDMGKGFG